MQETIYFAQQHELTNTADAGQTSCQLTIATLKNVFTCRPMSSAPPFSRTKYTRFADCYTLITSNKTIFRLACRVVWRRDLFFYYQRFMSAYISSYRKLCVRHRANTRRKAEVITLGKRSICGLCARRTRWNKITGKYVSPSMEIMLKHSKWKITLGINENDIEQSNSGVLVDVWRI